MWGVSQILGDFFNYNREGAIVFLMQAFESNLKFEGVKILSSLRETRLLLGLPFCLMHLF